MLRSFQDLVEILALFPSKYEAEYVPRKTVATDYDKLFALVNKGNYERDEELALALYGDSERLTMTRYYTTKSRLKERIEAALFVLDNDEMLPQESAEYKVWKELVRIWALTTSVKKTTNPANTSTIQGRLEKLAEESRILGLTDITAMCYERLRDIHAERGSLLIVRKYNNLIAQISEQKNVEILLANLHAELVAAKTKRSFLTPSFQEDCKAFVQAASDAYKKFPSPTIRLFYANASCFLAETAADFKNVISILTLLEQDFSTNYHRDESSLIARRKLPLILLLREKTLVASALEQATTRLPNNTQAYLQANEYALLTYIHAEDWLGAAQIWSFTAQSPAMMRFQNTSDFLRWSMYEIFLRTFLMPDKLSSEPVFPVRPTFFKRPFSRKNAEKKLLESMRSIKNTTSVSTYLVENIQIALQYAELLEAIVKRELTKILSSINALLVFQEKYVRKDTPQYRFQIFVRLLGIAKETNLDKQAIIEKESKYVQWLEKAHPFDIVQMQTLEVVPFDVLWRMLLEVLPDTKS